MKPWLFTLLLNVLGQEPIPYILGLPDSELYPQYASQAGKVNGYLPILLRRFAAESGIILHLKPYPIRRYLAEFGEGRIDFIAPSNPGWIENSISKKIAFSNPIMQSRAGLIGINKDIDPTKVKHLTTLSGYTTALVLDPRFQFTNVRVEYVNSINSAMMVLAARRTDLIYLHFDAAREWVRTHPEVKTPFYFHDQYSEVFDYHLATIKHPHIINNFNAWMQRNPNALAEAKASLVLTK